LVKKGEVTKVIRHDFGSEMYNLPDFKSIINFYSLGNLESEQRWKEDTLIWKKFFKYRENDLVDEIEIQNLQKRTEEKLLIRYDYDSANRVISEKIEGANSIVIEEQQIKYIKDTIKQSLFKYGKLKWKKYFVNEDGILRELIIFRKALQKATNHIKYNSNIFNDEIRKNNKEIR
jgi:hypothetical protein